MFGRLLKYEFRNSRRIIGLMSWIALAVAVVATISIKLLIVNVDNDSVQWQGLSIAVFMLVLLSFLALYAYFVASIVLLHVQFYKSKFTNEGYLTFTLPANVHQIYLSSLLNMLIWYAIVIIVLLVSIAMVILFGTDPDHFINTELFRSGLPALIQALDTALGNTQWTVVDTIRICIQSLISVLYTLVLGSSCVTIGATVAKKHKVLVAVGLYFLLGYISSAIVNTISISRTLNAVYMNSSVITSVSAFGTSQTVMNLIILVAGYFVTTYLMKKKLNLP